LFRGALFSWVNRAFSFSIPRSTSFLEEELQCGGYKRTRRAKHVEAKGAVRIMKGLSD
jgi:hypothetical protein